MKKMSMRALLSCLLGEIIVLLSCLFLTGDSNYYWIAVGVVAIILIITFYKCSCIISDIFLDWSKQRDENNSVMLQEMKNAQAVQQTEFLDKLKAINDSYISSNECIKKNIESVTELQSKILGSNKDTLMEISDFIKQIKEDNKRACEELTTIFGKNTDNLKKFQGNIVETLEILESIIGKGIKEQQEQDEKFKSAMGDLVDEKLTEYDRKLQEYNKTFASLGEKITEVINACHMNTANYEKTLSFIIDAQKEANSLNSKDIDLLKSLVKR